MWFNTVINNYEMSSTIWKYRCLVASERYRGCRQRQISASWDWTVRHIIIKMFTSINVHNCNSTSARHVKNKYRDVYQMIESLSYLCERNFLKQIHIDYEKYFCSVKFCKVELRTHIFGL